MILIFTAILILGCNKVEVEVPKYLSNSYRAEYDRNTRQYLLIDLIHPDTIYYREGDTVHKMVLTNEFLTDSPPIFWSVFKNGKLVRENSDKIDSIWADMDSQYEKD